MYLIVSFTASGFGQLRNDNDANCTYEGDNNVLLQQTSNFLLGLWSKRSTLEEFPMKTADYIRNGDQILNSTLPINAFALAKTYDGKFDLILIFC